MAEFDDKAEEDEVAAMFDLKMKKKKRTTKKKAEGEAGGGEGGAGEGGEGGVEGASDAAASSSSSSSSAVGVMEVDPPIYTYGQMLNRVVDLLHQNNPEMLEKRKYTMKPPQLMRGASF